MVGGSSIYLIYSLNGILWAAHWSPFRENARTDAMKFRPNRTLFVENLPAEASEDSLHFQFELCESQERADGRRAWARGEFVSTGLMSSVPGREGKVAKHVCTATAGRGTCSGGQCNGNMTVLGTRLHDLVNTAFSHPCRTQQQESRRKRHPGNAQCGL